MMITNPLRDFFVKAVMHAKQNRMSELNSIEAELIVVDDILHDAQKKGVDHTVLQPYQFQVYSIRRLIKDKKKEILS